MILRQVEIYRGSLALKQPMNFAGLTLAQRELAYVCAFNTQLKRPVRAELAPLPGFSQETLDQAIDELVQAAQGNTQALVSPSAAFTWDCLLHGITALPVPTDIPLLQGQGTQLIQDYRELNCPDQIKLKVARWQPSIELHTINQLIALNPNLRCRLDANQGWSLAQAQHFCHQLPPSHIEYIEEPCKHLADAIAALAPTGIKLALDEQLQQPQWPEPEMRHPSIHALIIKPSLVGSFSRIKALLNLAKQHQQRVIISSAFESPYGLGLLSQLAKMWTPNEVPGLDTVKYFTGQALGQHWPSWPSLKVTQEGSR
ncbi:o-succinylbenzoate synthase [Motilimonas eburnea]|uniref:o-succinylbenzoate synthase n=1 Tax=Motilimonas eburnea TaxID=1737488 RepID=UPI001E3EF0E9|nr:o-succinylbenzoate synthase [Motilimonas eburnea]MCE2573579.1 o-succinylbenzoate synthase [Motilimonas eburnea]